MSATVVIGPIVAQIVTLPPRVRVGGRVAKGLGGVEFCGPRTVEMDADELNISSLGGGWEAGTVRVGDTVRRHTGPWTPAVHALLRHLEAVGFDAAPRVLGVDSEGREILNFVDGEPGLYPLPERLWSDAVLDQAARLLRRYHDATIEFVPPPNASWLHGVREPVEVICHGDLAPYNCIYRGDRIVCFVDFDWAGARTPAVGPCGSGLPVRAAD
jgi:hypothetical protein